MSRFRTAKCSGRGALRPARPPPRCDRPPARDRRSFLRFPGSLDDVAVGIAALDAHVGRFVPLFLELDTAVEQPIAQRENCLTVREPNAEVHPGWADNWFWAWPESQREALSVVEHQNVIFIMLGRPRIEAKVL